MKKYSVVIAAIAAGMLVLICLTVGCVMQRAVPVREALPEPPGAPLQSTPFTDLTGRIVFVQADGIYSMAVAGTERVLIDASIAPTTIRSVLPAPHGTSLFVATAYGGWVLPFDHLPPLAITQHPVADAAWSPTGQSLALADRERIVILSVDGTRQHTIAPMLARDILWSPTGDYLSFVAGLHVYVARSDGSQLAQVTSVGGKHTFHSWSPDGRHLAVAESGAGQWNVYTIAIPDMHRQQLSTTGGAYLAWSPDNQYLAYLFGDVYLVTLKENREQQGTSMNRWATDLKWSPDSTRVAWFSAEAHWRSEPVWWKIYALHPDRPGVVQLTNNAIWAVSDLHWAPDSQSILFSGIQEASPAVRGVYLARADGSGLVQLVEHARLPIWLPQP